MSENEKIGARLREFGEKRYGTMAAFSRALHIDPQALNQYLTGFTKPGNVLQDRLRKIGADVEWIITGSTYREGSVERKTVNEPVAAIYGKDGFEKIIDAISDDLTTEFKRAPLGDLEKAKEGLKKVLRKYLRQQS
jgi:transcriptional regulator with XRE-family HTH domain